MCISLKDQKFRKKTIVIIVLKKDKILLLLGKQILFCQLRLPLSRFFISSYTYTLFYVLKVASRFGLIAPITRKFGYYL